MNSLYLKGTPYYFLISVLDAKKKNHSRQKLFEILKKKKTIVFVIIYTGV